MNATRQRIECVGDIANYLREPTPFQRAFSPQFCHYDIHRIAALGRKFDSPLNLLRGVLLAAILARPAGAQIVTADVSGMDLASLPTFGPGGHRLSAGGAWTGEPEWRVAKASGGRVLLVEVA